MPETVSEILDAAVAFIHRSPFPNRQLPNTNSSISSRLMRALPPPCADCHCAYGDGT